ncbi:MAG: hydrogenase maturation nickel metallochaperone HypA, partial [Rhodocyclaceae bacterium]|nr:hydrogenase maturation nickel metallochaperone HypA [Rhodocyclaceae bacterium]
MHEMSLAEGILQLVEDTARREQAKTVKTIVLEIGRLSAVEPEALKFCFAAVTRGSIAQDATLEV